MHRLTRHLLVPARRAWRRVLRRHDSDHGAVAALFAVTLSTGVVFGMGALVIDVGQLALERQELQTGADAASWAIANNCIRKPVECTEAKQLPIAQDLARRNTKDETADTQICIQGKMVCPTTWNAPDATCPINTVTGGTYVEVRVSTRTGATTVLPPTFAGLLSASNTGYQMGACGRVAWGPPAITKVLALGISDCDWQRMTQKNQAFYGPITGLLGQLGLYNVLGLPTPTANDESAIPMVTPLVLGSAPLPNCGLLQPTVPRGWVWLSGPNFESPDANCEIALKPDDLPRSFLLSGLLAGQNCANRLAAVRNSRLPVLVPIYDRVEPAPLLLSVAPQYHIVGFAPMMITGYSGLLDGLLGGVGSLLRTGSLPALLQSTLCGLSQCIYGYFTKSLVPVDKPEFGTGENYGATVIARTG